MGLRVGSYDHERDERGEQLRLPAESLHSRVYCVGQVIEYHLYLVQFLCHSRLRARRACSSQLSHGQGEALRGQKTSLRRLQSSSTLLSFPAYADPAICDSPDKYAARFASSLFM